MRWGDTLLDVTHIDAGGDFTLVDVVLVHEGELVAAPAGRVGQVEYTATAIELPARSVPFARHGDRRWLPYVAGALLAHLALWGAATINHPIERHAAVPTEPRPVRIARVASEPMKSYAPPDDRARDRVADTKSQGQAMAAQGPTGAAGARAPAARGHVAIKNTGEEAQLSKAEAVARARQAGVLGQTQVLLESYATLGGTERLTSAFDAIDVTAPLTGGEGTAGGSFGTGFTGGGAGGGGTTYGTIGVGRSGSFSSGTTNGHGWGGSVAPVVTTIQWHTWRDVDYTYGALPHRRLTGHYSTVTICPSPAQCNVDGSLDKAIVRRYVKRNIDKLSYCYEKELLGRPSLTGGNVNITFAVGADGRIHVARSTGFDDTIAFCTRVVFEAIELPKKGDALVEYVVHFAAPARP